jgi:hypothetical protein
VSAAGVLMPADETTHADVERRLVWGLHGGGEASSTDGGGR